MYKLALILLLFPSIVRAEETFLSPLKKNQGIVLNLTKGDSYEILILTEGLAFQYIVTEVGKDYIVVEDVEHIKEIRIPVYRIKNITKVKVLK